MAAQLSYWERNPPFAAVAFAKLLGVDLNHAADPKGTKETVATLRFSSGWVHRSSIAAAGHCLPAVCLPGTSLP